MNQHEKTTEEKAENEQIADLELSSGQAEQIQAGVGDAITYTFKVTNTSSVWG